MAAALLAAQCLFAQDHATVAPVAPGKPFPVYRVLLRGTNCLRVINPRNSQVRIAVRSGTKGITFDVPSLQAASVSISEGTFDIYFLYADSPAAAFKADPIAMDQGAVELLLSTTERGGYSMLEPRRR